MTKPLKLYYSLVIVGSGVSVRWMAFKAYQAGIRDILVVDTSQNKARFPGLIKLFSWDLITRPIVAHGEGFTQSFRRFVNNELSDVKNDLESALKMSINQIEFSRFLDSQHELNEYELHSKALSMPSSSFNFKSDPDIKSGILVQEPGEAFYLELDTCELKLNLILSTFNVPITTCNTSFNPQKDSKKINFPDSTEIEFDSLIIMDPNFIRESYPNMKDIFVLYKDAFIESNVGTVSNINNKVNFFVLSKYANNYFLKLRDKIYFGGFRYLDKDFGVENFTEIVSEKWVDHAVGEAQRICGLNSLDKKSFITHIQYGCLPCDELPIVGPMFGEQGVYLMSGFAQLDLSLSLCFTKPLLDLICTGKSSIHRRFYPERHRSLNDPAS